MADRGFYEDHKLRPVFYSCATPSNPPTPSPSSTALVLAPELPTHSQPPLFHYQQQQTIDDDEYFNNLPPGYGFFPSDEELIVCYLKRKLQNLPLPRNKITEVNLYDHHPQDLAEQHKSKIQQNYLYFFTPRDKKYKNGTRPKRAAGNGYWKATGADRLVKHKGRVVGLRKSLVYYVGKPQNGQKTNWLMHEFRMRDSPKPNTGTNDMKLDDWVLCRVAEKNNRHVYATKTQPFQNIEDINDETTETSFVDQFSLRDQYDVGLLDCPNSFPSFDSSFDHVVDFGYNVGYRNPASWTTPENQ